MRRPIQVEIFNDDSKYLNCHPSPPASFCLGPERWEILHFHFHPIQIPISLKFCNYTKVIFFLKFKPTGLSNLSGPLGQSAIQLNVRLPRLSYSIAVFRKCFQIMTLSVVDHNR